MMAPFEVGRSYNRRRDLHGVYGGQTRGGISTPTNQKIVLLFTGESGEAHGYYDQFQRDGTFWYTGEGQRGNMEMVRGNKAIRDHQRNGKALHLFQITRNGEAQYVGEATYLGHRYAERPDTEGNSRQAIIFELDITYPQPRSVSSARIREAEPIVKHWTRPMAELRRLAIEQPSADATEVERRSIARLRSEAVRVYVLRRSNAVCEACGATAPFRTKEGRPYLEPHHIRRVADGGPDHPRWVAAVCPNCHREVHHGQHGERINEQLSRHLGEIENE